MSTGILAELFHVSFTMSYVRGVSVCTGVYMYMCVWEHLCVYWWVHYFPTALMYRLSVNVSRESILLIYCVNKQTAVSSETVVVTVNRD